MAVALWQDLTRLLDELLDEIQTQPSPKSSTLFTSAAGRRAGRCGPRSRALRCRTGERDVLLQRQDKVPTVCLCPAASPAGSGCHPCPRQNSVKAGLSSACG